MQRKNLHNRDLHEGLLDNVRNFTDRIYKSTNNQIRKLDESVELRLIDEDAEITKVDLLSPDKPKLSSLQIAVSKQQLAEINKIASQYEKNLINNSIRDQQKEIVRQSDEAYKTAKELENLYDNVLGFSKSNGGFLNLGKDYWGFTSMKTMTLYLGENFIDAQIFKMRWMALEAYYLYKESLASPIRPIYDGFFKKLGYSISSQLGDILLLATCVVGGSVVTQLMKSLSKAKSAHDVASGAFKSLQVIESLASIGITTGGGIAAKAVFNDAAKDGNPVDTLLADALDTKVGEDVTVADILIGVADGSVAISQVSQDVFKVFKGLGDQIKDFAPVAGCILGGIYILLKCGSEFAKYDQYDLDPKQMALIIESLNNSEYYIYKLNRCLCAANEFDIIKERELKKIKGSYKQYRESTRRNQIFGEKNVSEIINETTDDSIDITVEYLEDLLSKSQKNLEKIYTEIFSKESNSIKSSYNVNVTSKKADKTLEDVIVMTRAISKKNGFVSQIKFDTLLNNEYRTFDGDGNIINKFSAKYSGSKAKFDANDDEVNKIIADNSTIFKSSKFKRFIDTYNSTELFQRDIEHPMITEAIKEQNIGKILSAIPLYGANVCTALTELSHTALWYSTALDENKYAKEIEESKDKIFNLKEQSAVNKLKSLWQSSYSCPNYDFEVSIPSLENVFVEETENIDYPEIDGDFTFEKLGGSGTFELGCVIPNYSNDTVEKGLKKIIQSYKSGQQIIVIAKSSKSGTRDLNKVLSLNRAIITAGNLLGYTSDEIMSVLKNRKSTTTYSNGDVWDKQPVFLKKKGRMDLKTIKEQEKKVVKEEFGSSQINASDILLIDLGAEIENFINEKSKDKIESTLAAIGLAYDKTGLAVITLKGENIKKIASDLKKYALDIESIKGNDYKIFNVEKNSTETKTKDGKNEVKTNITVRRAKVKDETEKRKDFAKFYNNLFSIFIEANIDVEKAKFLGEYVDIEKAKHEYIDNDNKGKESSTTA